MNCQSIKETLPAYLDGTLRPEEAKTIEQHIATCEGCRAEYDSLKAIYATFEAVPKTYPVMRERFVGALEAYRRGYNEGEKTSSFQLIDFLRNCFRGLRLVPVQVAILFVVFIVGRESQTQFMGGLPKETRLDQLEEQVADLREVTAYSLLTQPLASDRLLGIERLSSLKLPESDVLPALYERLYVDNNVNVKLAALDAIKAFSADPAVREKLIAYLDKPNSPLLRFALMQTLLEYRDERSLPVLERISRDAGADASLAEMARSGIQYLKGENNYGI